MVEEEIMANKNKLKSAAARIGATVGRIDGTAHKAAHKASVALDVAKGELNDVAKQVEALKKQLAKSSKKLQAALR
jgi:predicted translin family RNA/ssDNA-binding protein